MPVLIVESDKILAMDGGGQDSVAYILMYRCVASSGHCNNGASADSQGNPAVRFVDSGGQTVLSMHILVYYAQAKRAQ